jgi:hypothetical protein
MAADWGDLVLELGGTPMHNVADLQLMRRCGPTIRWLTSFRHHQC